MGRKLLAALLGVGALAGFASGFHHLRHGPGGCHGPGSRKAAFEARVAEVCVRAADKVARERSARAPDPP